MNVNIINKRAILLTGTIIPNSVYTNYLDAESRLKDYIKAIDFYCKVFNNDDVFFLENSDFDLNLNEEYNKLKLKYSFSLIKFPRSERFYEGKGYQEFQMVDAAVEELKNKYCSFVKITGRYIIKNANKICDQESEGMIVDLHRKNRMAQSYLMCFSEKFYSANLKNEFKKVNDNEGKFIERVIYEKIVANNLFGQCRLFEKTPIMEGISGSYSITLKRNSFKIFIRNIERYIFKLLKVKTFYY